MINFTLEMHQIELRFEYLRIINQTKIRSLLGNIAINGQLEPLTVIKKSENLYILIDGYQRYTVLKILGKDQVVVTISDEKEGDALINLLRKGDMRKWSAIEEAGVIQYLHRELELPLGRIATKLGRSKSFLSRRIDLLEKLPEQALKLVMTGAISIWSATRVIVPLALANTQSVGKLITYLEKVSTSSRELKLFYDIYLRSSRVKRNRMLESPELFFKIVEKPPKTPEEKWIRDAAMVCGILTRLVDQIELVIFPKQDRYIKKTVRKKASSIQSLSMDLQARMEVKYEDEKRGIKGDDSGDGEKRDISKKNCQTVENIKKHGEEISSVSGALKKRS